MKEWGHMTTTREVERGENCPVGIWSAIVEWTEGKRMKEKQADNNQPPQVEEWNRRMVYYMDEEEDMGKEENHNTSFHSPRFQLTKWNISHVLILELMCAMSCPSITSTSDGILQNQPENGLGYIIEEGIQAGGSIDAVRIRLLSLGNCHD